jgi:RNA-directed DNA polymerase
MRITDGSVLKLIERWLKAPIVEKEKKDDGNWRIKVEKPTKGTPQGGVISPLLANIYLHWFDKRLQERGGPLQNANAKLIRYADDFIVMAKYMGRKLTERIQYLIEDWLKLEINKEKTKIVTLFEIGNAVDFLGFTFRVERSHFNSGTYIRIEPKKKAIEKAREKIREITSRSMNHIPVAQVIGKMNSFLEGWKGYFELGHPDRIFRDVDHYVRKSMENHLNRRSQRGHSKPKELTWYAYLKKLGLRPLYNKKAVSKR